MCVRVDQVTCNNSVADRLKVLRRGLVKKINIRKFDDDSVSGDMTGGSGWGTTGGSGWGMTGGSGCGMIGGI